MAERAHAGAAPRSMDREALARARDLLHAALRDIEVEPRHARHAQSALRREQGRLRGHGMDYVHLNAARVACAQLAAGLAPGRLKLSACLQILAFHMSHG